MNDYLHRAQKIMKRINELAAISEDESCITRTFGTKPFVEGSQKVLSWMKEAGLQTRIDNIGNVRGRLTSSNANAKTLVIGSHIDTVVNAGKFDGPLGVIIGLDVVEQLIQSKQPLPFHIELIGFSDEEGVRFHSTYLGSKVVAGSFDLSILKKKDATDISLREVIHTLGGDIDQLSGDAIGANHWLGYFEIHIEQGPVLYEKNIPVAIVEGIAGQVRAEIVLKGVAGHAGTVPIDMRNDALCAAAEFILEVENFAKINKNDVVATIGKLLITNAASNVIPGEVFCSLDLRSSNETLLSSAYQTLQKIAQTIGSKRNIALEWNLIQKTRPVACHLPMNTLLALAIKDSGYEVIHLVSGAGHDAVPISDVSPVCMLFVKCFEGISHNPLENVELSDIAAAVEISDNFIQHLIKNVN